MNPRLLSFQLIFILLMSLSACGSKRPGVNNGTDENPSPAGKEEAVTGAEPPGLRDKKTNVEGTERGGDTKMVHKEDSTGTKGQGGDSQAKPPQKAADQESSPRISEQQAIELAKRAVKTSFAKNVPEDAELQVKLRNGRYEIAFLRPKPAKPVPSSGYYVMVWVNSSDGSATVLGEP